MLLRRRHAAVLFLALALVEGCHVSVGSRSQGAQAPYPTQRTVAGGYVPPAAPPPAPAPPPPPPPMAQAPLAAPPPSAGPAAARPDAATPPGWTNLGGLMVPVIPGITAGGASPFPGLTLPGAAPAVAPAPAPALAAFTGRQCGKADVNGRKVALDCITPGYGDIPWAKRAIVQRSWLDGNRKGFAGDTPLPATVDHRIGNQEGPVRDQGEVSACTAFSLTAAVDHALARATNRPAAMSVQQVWARYHTPVMASAASENRGRVVSPEAAYPYSVPEACSWTTPCEVGECGPKVACGQAPSLARLGQADEKAYGKITQVTRLTDGDTDSFKEVLAKGQDVWFAMYAGARFMYLRGRDVVVPDEDWTGAPSGHAMVLAGYKTQTNGTYFLIHNSWGQDWGDKGYAWIHEATLKRNLRSAYVVEAEPVAQNGAPLQIPTPTPAQVAPPPAGKPACAAGTAPDSITGECVPPCLDGSPRAKGVCPTPQASSSCPPGNVNLFGFCVMAAPQKPPSQDPVSGVRGVCGGGGCTYVLSSGQHGCQQFFCTHSCPAPKYVLTAGPDGLGCSE